MLRPREDNPAHPDNGGHIHPSGRVRSAERPATRGERIMKRRDFLTRTAAGAAAIAGAGVSGLAQAGPPAPQAPPTGRGGPSPIGQPGQPANVPPHKLARISLMQLNFNNVLLPEPSANNPNPTPTPLQTMTIFDLPKMYVENYGVHNIEFQLDRIVKSETDPDFIKRLKAALDEHKMTMTQVNMEIGVPTGMTGDAAGRRQGLDRLKKWIDIANQYGCKRLMLNQNQNGLTKEKRADAVAYMKELADAGRPSGVMFSVETRGQTSPELQANLGMKAWEFMIGIIEEAGAHSNVDLGNVGAMDQAELHACIKRWHARSSGNMHIKSSPYWDIGRAVAFAESIGYKGNYSIEVAAHSGQRMVYNTILANIA
jgi:sugar phosphate isomerase/epimerase